MTLTRAAVATIKPLTEPSLLTTGETAQEFLLKLMLGLTQLELGAPNPCTVFIWAHGATGPVKDLFRTPPGPCLVSFSPLVLQNPTKKTLSRTPLEPLYSNI